MASPEYTIPSQYSSQLRPTSPKDTRTDDAILQSLSHHAPVTSEKNVWAFWHSGLANMPAWNKRNVIAWVRILDPSWTVRILDSIPDSSNYALKYVSKDLLPQAFVNGTMDGPYAGPHSADFLRGACIWTYGGVYMDVGNILIRDLDRVCWRQLEDPNSPFEVSVPWMYGNVMANHFVAGRKGSIFIKRWHDLFMHLWKDVKNHDSIIENPLVSFALTQDFSESQARGFNWDFAVEARTVFGYIGQVLAWQRVTMLEGPDEDGFSGLNYWMNKVLLFDVLSENWGAEQTIGFSAKKLFDCLATPVEPPQETEEYKTARNLTWRLLTKSTMQKVTHGKGLTKDPALGMLWEKPENERKDCTPGTFAELLRYGSVHFQQTRESVDYVEAKRPKVTMKKGLLEV